jgi:hypothetical protein
MGHMGVLRSGAAVLLWAGIWAGLASLSHGQIRPPDDPINLDPMLITTRSDDDGYDATGMGAQEAELHEPPFSNDMLTGQGEDSEAVGELNIELGMIATASPADLVAGLNRLNLRGIPDPASAQWLHPTGRAGDPQRRGRGADPGSAHAGHGQGGARRDR